MQKENLLRKIKASDIIFKKKVKLRSGLASDMYVDVKKAYGDPLLLDAIAQSLAKNIPKQATTIAASGYGGLPLAALVALRSKRQLTLVREKAKSHGKGGSIDGYVPTTGDRIVIVDDVFTTGSSILATAKSLRHTGAKILHARVVVRRTDAKLRFPVKHLFTLRELTGT